MHYISSFQSKMGLREEVLKKVAEVGKARYRGGGRFGLPFPPYFVFAREPFSRFIRYRFVNAITKFDTSLLIILMLTQVFLACNVGDAGVYFQLHGRSQLIQVSQGFRSVSRNTKGPHTSLIFISKEDQGGNIFRIQHGGWASPNILVILCPDLPRPSKSV